MKINKKELCRHITNVIYKEDYRIVYLYDIYHEAPQRGYYAKKIEDFAPYEPIDELCEIPPVVSVDYLLERYIKTYNFMDGIVLYKVDGTRKI